MTEWISVKDRLPDAGKYVQGWYCGGNWIDDDNNCNQVVICLNEEHSDEDECMWLTFGPDSYEDYEISYWRELEDPPQQYKG